MRRFVLLAVPVVGLAFVATAVAKPRIELDTQAISSAQCTPPGSGAKQVVDVRFRLTNYDDSGYDGAWAIDSVNRRVRIWKHTDGTFCAQIQDNGSTFVTVAGPSPDGSSGITAGIKGTFDGGYITTAITGKFVPRYPTHGDLGTFDAKCTPDFDCPGAHPTWASYFNRPSAEQFVQWGWIYTAGSYGTWLDQLDVVPPRGGDIRG